SRRPARFVPIGGRVAGEAQGASRVQAGGIGAMTVPHVKRGYIFDLDGTLADSMPAHFLAWTRTAELFGLSFPEDEFYELGGVPTLRIAAMLAERARIEVDPAKIARYKEQAFSDSLATLGIIQPIAPVVAIAE